MKNFGIVKSGDFGGFIESEKNLSIYDNAWVFGDACVYGSAILKNNKDYTTIKGFGTVQRNTTFFRCRDNTIKVSCGCFFGTIEEFREQKNTRTGKVAKEYLLIADLMEYHFGESEENENE